jgi:hypothetical protein
MAMLTLDAIGPRGEELAMEAGKITDIPVGFDPEFKCATFDSDLPAEELQAIVFDALGGIEPGWQEHLRVSE